MRLTTHRLLPHEPVQAQQQPRGHRRDQADGAFPFAGHALELLDALHEHAAAPGNHQREQTAGHRAGERLAHRHPPGHVADRQQRGPQPAINRPHRVAGRVRNPGIKRARHQFAGVLQRQLGRQGEQIDRPDHPEGDRQRQPVDVPEQRRHRSPARARTGGGFGGLRPSRSEFFGFIIRSFTSIDTIPSPIRAKPDRIFDLG